MRPPVLAALYCVFFVTLAEVSPEFVVNDKIKPNEIIYNDSVLTK